MSDSPSSPNDSVVDEPVAAGSVAATAAEPSTNPLSVDVLPLAVRAIDVVARKHNLAGRCGGHKHVDAAIARVESLEGERVATHVDESALDHAARAAACAILHAHRAIKEHADANANDVALDRAEALLVEAAALIECVAHVDVHRERIARTRADAVEKARGAAENAAVPG